MRISLGLFIMTGLVIAAAGCAGTSVKEKHALVRLCINRLDGEGVEADVMSAISEVLYREISEIRGKERVLLRERDGIDKSANRQLVGRISKLGSTYIVAVKVVEGEKGSLLFDRTVTVTKDTLEDELEDVAEEIGDDGGIW